MTDNEAEILNELRAFGAPARPLDVGGSDASHHSKILRRMEPKGWVTSEVRRSLGMRRPGRLYTLTPAGAQALANHLETKRLAAKAREETIRRGRAKLEGNRYADPAGK